MIRTTSLHPLATPSPARRHAVIAVLTGSTSRDITVARLAAQQASAAAAQLVLAVPVPAKPFSPTAADLTGRWLAPQAATVATRVLPRLDHPTSSIALITVPFADRGYPVDRSRRIAAALIEVSRRLAARQLIVASTPVGELDAAGLSAELTVAAEGGRLPLTRLTVVPHTQTIGRPPRAVGTMRDEPADSAQSVPAPRPSADQSVQTEQAGQPVPTITASRIS